MMDFIEKKLLRHGDKIASPYLTREHGRLFHVYRIHTLVGSALEIGSDPVGLVQRATQYWWLEQLPLPLSGHHGDVVGVFDGDTINVEGRKLVFAGGKLEVA